MEEKFYKKLHLTCGKTFIVSAVVVSSLSPHVCFEHCEEHKYRQQEHTREEDRTPRGAQLYTGVAITDSSGSVSSVRTDSVAHLYTPNSNNYPRNT